MGQRINITYSIDIKELQQEVKRLWRKAEDKISSLQIEDIEEEHVLSHSSIEMLESVREQIADIDYCLADIGSIILSYNAHKSDEMRNLHDDKQHKIDELQQKLQNFNDSVLSDEVPS
tara:strand:+ start:1882 stop:2235 length:354 start_codon:yes stop_codon:yes gene_type:complete